MDFIYQGQANGSVAATLLRNCGRDGGFDPRLLRPYVSDDGTRTFVDQTINGENVAVPVNNANATLLVREWIELDKVVVRAALPRLKAVAEIRGRNLEFTIANGFGKTVLQFQNQSDISGANISMSGVAKSKGDRPLYDLSSLPLPIIHKDFQFEARELAVSRNGSMPLDTTMAALAARRVAEGAEQLLLGTAPTYTYGGGTVYGFTNFPSRITYALTSPLVTAWTPKTLVNEILAMRQAAANKLHTGPYILLTSLAWDAYLDNDLNSLSANSSNITLRQRIQAIEGIQSVVTVDYLPGYDMILVQTTPDTVREVIGMDLTTLQWPTEGGMELNFKVMCIMVPQLRADFNGNCGVVHGAVAGQTTHITNEILVKAGNP